ncbi:MAG: WD40/YVTN/BNR-like repeat-containing protein [Acidimicrobiales bacterium]
MKVINLMGGWPMGKCSSLWKGTLGNSVTTAENQHSRTGGYRVARLVCVATLVLVSGTLAACTTSSNQALKVNPANAKNLRPNINLRHPRGSGTSVPITPPKIAPVSSVNPGSNIQFVTSDTGWRLEGVYMGSRTVTSSYSEGLSIDESTDGGHTWKAVYTDSNGIWGFDFLSTTTGWVVGTASLARTTDAGASWQDVGEPTGHPLILVNFVSSSVGFGLTTIGQLVQSTDGGASWHASTLAVPATSLCFTSGHTGYAASVLGADVYSTSDRGAVWKLSYTSTLPANYGAFKSSYLSCNTAGVWYSVIALNGGASGASALPYFVSYHAAQSSGWSTVAADGNSWSAVANNLQDPNFKPPVAPMPVDNFSWIAAGPSGTGLIIGYSTLSAGWPGNMQVGRLTGTSHSSYAAGYVPALFGQGAGPEGGSRMSMSIRGVSFVGSDGWILLNDDDVSPDLSKTETIVLRTTDGGSSWSIAYQGAPYQRP